jgi:hypothetical protein
MVLLTCGHPWCVTSSAPPAQFLAAGLLQPTLHAQALVLFNPYAFLPLIFPLPHSFPLMRANAPVHNSYAPEVSPQPKCEIVAIFLWPANRPFVGCLLPRRSARSAFACWLGRLPVAARLSPRLAFRDSPSGATAGAAAEAEIAWCCGTGGRAGGTFHFMTGSDPERVYFTNPAQSRRVKKKYII